MRVIDMASDPLYQKGYTQGVADGRAAQRRDDLEARASATAAIQHVMAIHDVQAVKHVGDGSVATAVKVALQRSRAIGWDAGHASGYQRALAAVDAMLAARGLSATGYKADPEDLAPALDALTVRHERVRAVCILVGVLTAANILWWMLR